MKFIITYLITGFVFFAIDMIWLGWLAKDFYWKKLDFILDGPVNWKAAGIFYLLYIAGILYFAVFPGLESGRWQLALLNGALFGFFCYATYDLTNMALIAKWPLEIVVVDILWGTVLTGATSCLTFLISRHWVSGWF